MGILENDIQKKEIYFAMGEYSKTIVEGLAGLFRDGFVLGVRGGFLLGFFDGFLLGFRDGFLLGFLLGFLPGLSNGFLMGFFLGFLMGFRDDFLLGLCEGSLLGFFDGFLLAISMAQKQFRESLRQSKVEWVLHKGKNKSCLALGKKNRKSLRHC